MSHAISSTFVGSFLVRLLKFSYPNSFTKISLLMTAVNETFIKSQADRLVSSGLAGAGYNTVIVDGESLEKTKSVLQYAAIRPEVLLSTSNLVQ